MGIKHYDQTVIECDICSDVIDRPYDKTFSIKQARDRGWKIGKKVACPLCYKKQLRRQGNEH